MSARLEAIAVKFGVYLHHRKGRRQLGAVDLAKPMLLVETVRRQKFRGGAEVDRMQAVRAGPRQQRFEQAARHARARAARAGQHKHFAQRRLASANVEQRDRTDDLPAVQRHPEITRAALV